MMSEAVQIAMITVLATTVTVGLPLAAGLITVWLNAKADSKKASDAVVEAKQSITTMADKQDAQHDAWNSRLDEFKAMVISEAQAEIATARAEFETKLSELKAEVASLKRASP